MANYYMRLLRTKTLVCFFCFCIMLGCNDASEKPAVSTDKKSEKQSTVKKDDQQKPDRQADKPKPSPDKPKEYNNARFKGVTVQKISDGKYRVQGKAQIFEASFSWVVEDGHNELKKGHEMTDAGAPEWGNFQFTVDVKKQRAASTLTLILFEVSAKDGSRQHELPITLE
jgi:hypothetical protein